MEARGHRLQDLVVACCAQVVHVHRVFNKLMFRRHFHKQSAIGSRNALFGRETDETEFGHQRELNKFFRLRSGVMDVGARWLSWEKKPVCARRKASERSTNPDSAGHQRSRMLRRQDWPIRSVFRQYPITRRSDESFDLE